MEDEKWWDTLVGFTFTEFDADLGVARFERGTEVRHVNCWDDDVFELPTINTAAEATDFAINWQHEWTERDHSYGTLILWQSFFERLVERFPELADEFRENGII